MSEFGAQHSCQCMQEWMQPSATFKFSRRARKVLQHLLHACVGLYKRLIDDLGIMARLKTVLHDCCPPSLAVTHWR